MWKTYALKSMIILSLSGLILFSACSGFTPQPTPEVQTLPDEPFVPVVSATGVVVPEKWVTLSMANPGIVAEVLVAEGDTVEADQRILMLKQQQPQETYEAAIAAAQLELASAQQALQDLYDAHPIQVAQIELDLATARDALNDAEYRWTVQQEGNRANTSTIDAAEANLVLAEQEVKDAERAFNKVSGRREDDPIRAAALSNLAAARQHRDAVLRQLNWFKGHPTEIDQEKLDAEVNFAQALLDELTREWDTLQNGPDPEIVALAQERITNAEAQLEAAKSALAEVVPNLELRAPFNGTVAEVNVQVGEWVSPGMPLFLIADLAHLRVETSDLNEIDVAQITVGDTALVSFDALVDVVVQGVIEQIALKASPGAGVNYTVIIELAEVPENLRWGMTAFVDVQVDS